MTTLITLSDIQAVKPISANVEVTTKITPNILEAQELDLRTVLGEELYIDLLQDFAASPSLVHYADLFNGATYVYNTRTYQFQGVKMVLIYFFYARYLTNVQQTSTPYGEVNKTNQFSTYSDAKVLAAKIAQAKSAALVYQDRVIEFIVRHRSDYPLYRGFADRSEERSGISISGIGGNQKVGSSYRCRSCGKYTGCNCDPFYR